MKARIGAAVAAVFLVLLCALPTFASIRIVRVSYIDGNVSISRGTGDGAKQAMLNMPVIEGTSIVTKGEDARAEIEFENKSTVRLAGSGRIYFRELSTDDKGETVNLIEVSGGIVYLGIKKKHIEDFRLAFNNEFVTVPDNAHVRLVVAGNQAAVSVFEGDVVVKGRPEEVKVGSGETVTLKRTEGDHYELNKGIEPDAYDAFDKARNKNRRHNANNYNDMKQKLLDAYETTRSSSQLNLLSHSLLPSKSKDMELINCQSRISHDMSEFAVYVP